MLILLAFILVLVMIVSQLKLVRFIWGLNIKSHLKTLILETVQ